MNRLTGRPWMYGPRMSEPLTSPSIVRVASLRRPAADPAAPGAVSCSAPRRGPSSSREVVTGRAVAAGQVGTDDSNLHAPILAD